MDANQQNMGFSEKRQTLTKLLLNLYSNYQNIESIKLYSNDELYRLIRDLLTVISDNNQANILALRAYDALQDDESRRIYACLFLCRCIGVTDIAGVSADTLLVVLKNRLMEKGKDLSDYDDYDCDFFLGKQYFSLPQMKFLRGDNEVFVDCGAYDGKTIKDFVEFSGGKYNKIYSFEPIPRLYEEALRNIKSADIQRVELIQKGVWSHEAV